jgi:hypothetical protein
VLACSLGAVVAPDQPNKVAMMVVVFLIDTGQAVFNPTYSSLLPQLVGRQDLPGAVSLHSAQMNISRVVGPVLGASATRPSARRRCSSSAVGASCS